MDYQKIADYIYSLDKTNIFNAITKYCIQKDQKLAPTELEDITSLSITDQAIILIRLYRQYTIDIEDSDLSQEDIVSMLTLANDLLNNPSD